MDFYDSNVTSFYLTREREQAKYPSILHSRSYEHVKCPSSKTQAITNKRILVQ